MVTSCDLCADAATIARVIRVSGRSATVEADGCRTKVAVDLVPDVAADDLVLCQAGVALQRVDP